MNRYGYLAFCLALILMSAILAIALHRGDDPDKLSFERTRIDTSESEWTGEVVKQEEIEQGLYKVLTWRSGSEKMDTLLTTTKLLAGTKVKYVKVTTQDVGTGTSSTVRFAFPLEPGK